jgi:hypothetical protein
MIWLCLYVGALNDLLAMKEKMKEQRNSLKKKKKI